MPFSRRSTSHFLIESQTLTIWPWNDLDLGMTLTSDKSNQVKLILKLDLDMVKMYHHTKNEVSMSNYSKVIALTDTHTDTTKTLPPPHTRIPYYVNFCTWSRSRHTFLLLCRGGYGLVVTLVNKLVTIKRDTTNGCNKLEHSTPN